MLRIKIVRLHGKLIHRMHRLWVVAMVLFGFLPLSSCDARVAASRYDYSPPDAGEVQRGELRVEPRAILRGHDKSVYSLAFSSDGAVLAAGSGEEESFGFAFRGQINLWDTKTNAPLRTLRAHKAPVLDLEFLGNHNLISTGGAEIISWDIANGERSRLIRSRDGIFLTSAISADRSIFVTATRGKGDVSIWNARTGQPLKQLKGHKETVASLALSPSNPVLATGSYDKTFRIWDRNTWALTNTIKLEYAVRKLCFSPDGRLLFVAGSYDDSSALWSTVSWTSKVTLEESVGVLWDVAFSPSGAYLATVSDGLKLWDVRTGALLLKWQPPKVTSNAISYLNVKAVAFAPDGKMIAVGCSDATVRILRVRHKQ